MKRSIKTGRHVWAEMHGTVWKTYVQLPKLPSNLAPPNSHISCLFLNPPLAGGPLAGLRSPVQMRWKKTRCSDTLPLQNPYSASLQIYQNLPNLHFDRNLLQPQEEDSQCHNVTITGIHTGHTCPILFTNGAPPLPQTPTSCCSPKHHSGSRPSKSSPALGKGATHRCGNGGVSLW